MATAPDGRIAEAQRALTDLGLPTEQRNERAALTLLALLDLEPTTPWARLETPLRGVTPIMDFVARHYGKQWAPNTRETIRRFTLHQFLDAGLVVANPDRPDRPTNSPAFCYQIEPAAAAVLRKFNSGEWEPAVKEYIKKSGTLAQEYAQAREMHRIPLRLEGGETIALSPGGQNALVQLIVEHFCPRFTPGATPVYIGDTDEKWAFFDEARLGALGVRIESHGKMPDVVVHYTTENWLVLIEAVTSHGPVNPKRLKELKTLFSGASAGLVFVTAFMDRATFSKYMGDIAWETEVWVAESPGHMIHFNGERFLGPYGAG